MPKKKKVLFLSDSSEELDSNSEESDSNSEDSESNSEHCVIHYEHCVIHYEDYYYLLDLARDFSKCSCVESFVSDKKWNIAEPKSLTMEILIYHYYKLYNYKSYSNIRDFLVDHEISIEPYYDKFGLNFLKHKITHEILCDYGDCEMNYAENHSVTRISEIDIKEYNKHCDILKYDAMVEDCTPLIKDVCGIINEYAIPEKLYVFSECQHITDILKAKIDIEPTMYFGYSLNTTKPGDNDEIPYNIIVEFMKLKYGENWKSPLKF